MLNSNASILTNGLNSYGLLVQTKKRRIKTEENAKFVAGACRTELIKFLTTLAIFHHDDLKI